MYRSIILLLQNLGVLQHPQAPTCLRPCHSLQSGVSLFSASSSVSLSPLPVTEILLKISVRGTKTFRTKVPVTYPRVYGKIIFRTKVPATYPRVYGKIFHFSRSIRSNTIYGMTDVPYLGRA